MIICNIIVSRHYGIFIQLQPKEIKGETEYVLLRTMRC